MISADAAVAPKRRSRSSVRDPRLYAPRRARRARRGESLGRGPPTWGEFLPTHAAAVDYASTDALTSPGRRPSAACGAAGAVDRPDNMPFRPNPGRRERCLLMVDDAARIHHTGMESPEFGNNNREMVTDSRSTTEITPNSGQNIGFHVRTADFRR